MTVDILGGISYGNFLVLSSSFSLFAFLFFLPPSFDVVSLIRFVGKNNSSMTRLMPINFHDVRV